MANPALKRVEMVESEGNPIDDMQVLRLKPFLRPADFEFMAVPYIPLSLLDLPFLFSFC